jgi:hypothetical protein
VSYSVPDKIGLERSRFRRKAKLRKLSVILMSTMLGMGTLASSGCGKTVIIIIRIEVLDFMPHSS